MKHHPDDALLLDYASGAAAEAVALIVASHLAFCAQCRGAVAVGEAAGGVLLDEIAPVPISDAALEAALRRLDAPAAEAPQPASRDGTPSPLRALLGGDLSKVRWHKMGPRLAYAPLMRRRGMSVRLLRGAPGTDVGRHSHRGQEYTLVLKGGYTDETGSYGPGDFQIATPDLEHNPVADPGEDCINLAVTTAPLRFDAMIQKIAGKLFGF